MLYSTVQSVQHSQYSTVRTAQSGQHSQYSTVSTVHSTARTPGGVDFA